jgi:hypothetical protein
MKTILVFFVFMLSVSLWARNDIDLSSFNKEFSRNMQEVLDDNPQIYEKKGRAPASIESDTKKVSEQLDDFDEQATGPNEL